MVHRVTGERRPARLNDLDYAAFVPLPLPPDPPLDFVESRQRLMERALLALGRLDAITTLLPDPTLFLYGYVRREAVLSSQIEGTQSSLSDLLLFELDQAPGVPFDDVVEVSNYIGALDLGLELLRNGLPLSNRLIREVHGRLLARGRGVNKRPGEFRREPVWIGGLDPAGAEFVPPPADEVERCMADLERYLNDRGAGGALVKAALAHVQFETIHPFLDGNGRVGRLLIALILAEEGVLREPLLYLSLYFKRHRSEYYRLLNTVRETGDWEAWLDFFLTGVEETATAAVDTAHRLMEVFERDAAQVRGLGRFAGTALRVLDAMRARPVASVNLVRDESELRYASAARGIRALEELGIVREFTGRRRERVYAYSKYLSILTEGTEPLR
jgi:Fic family protein